MKVDGSRFKVHLLVTHELVGFNYKRNSMYSNKNYIQLRKDIYMVHSPNGAWRMGSRPQHGKGKSRGLVQV